MQVAHYHDSFSDVLSSSDVILEEEHGSLVDANVSGVTDHLSFQEELESPSHENEIHIVEDSDFEMIFSEEQLMANHAEAEDSSSTNDDEEQYDTNGAAATSRHVIETTSSWEDRKPSAKPNPETVSLAGKDIAVLEAAYAAQRAETTEIIPQKDISGVAFAQHHESQLQQQLEVEGIDKETVTEGGIDTFNNLMTPSEMDIVDGLITDEPMEMDILDGRGAIVRENPGNVRMREIVQNYIQEYRDAPSRNKAPIVRAAVEEIESGGVRFWVVVKAKTKKAGAEHRLATPEEIYDKVWHCFRSIITKQNRAASSSGDDSTEAPSRKRTKTAARLEAQPIKVETCKVSEPISFAIPPRYDVEQGAVRVGGEDDEGTVASEGKHSTGIVEAELVDAEMLPNEHLVVATKIRKDGCSRRKELWIGLCLATILGMFGIFMAVFAPRKSTSSGSYDDDDFATSPTSAPTVRTSERYMAFSALLEPYFEYNSTFPESDLQDSAMSWLADIDQYFEISETNARNVLERYVAYLLLVNWGISSMTREALSSLHICDWSMYTCNEADLIMGLQFSGLSKTAPVPTEIGLLRQLEAMEAHSGHVIGTLPAEIGRCTNLRQISLNYCSLSGFLPPEFSSLSRLELLDLANNGLQGEIPSAVGNMVGLKKLELSSNGFSGKFPMDLTELTMLTYLGLKYNELTGSIPSELGNLLQLQHFDCYWNRLSGPLPSELGLLTKLTLINLFNNLITGTLPSELGSLRRLTMLDLDGNSMTGTLPTEIGGMVALKSLFLTNNVITGTLPTEIGLMTSLVNVQMDGMQLAGTLPEQIGNVTTLMYFNVEGSRLTGTIPTTFGNLEVLNDIWLNQNQFTGTIPTEFGQLLLLEGLQLHENLITGTLPIELSTMEALMVLNLYKTEVEGTIPSEYGMLTKLNVLDLRETLVTGTLPTEFANLTSLVVWWERTDA